MRNYVTFVKKHFLFILLAILSLLLLINTVLSSLGKSDTGSTEMQEASSKEDLFDQIPYSNDYFDVSLKSDVDNDYNILVILTGSNSRIKFEEWLSEYSYNQSKTEFFYIENY